MSKIENNDTKNNDNNNPPDEKKGNINKNIKKLNSLLSNLESEKTREETIRDNKNKKHVSFLKPVYILIDVESYKKYNEDISETRFYYNVPEKKKTKEKKEAHCECILF